MNWNSVKHDSYYQARALEESARRAGTPEAWREFAELKAGKGSYALASYGFLNGALACEPHDVEQALALYGLAFQNARRSRSAELAMTVAYRHALLAQRAERWDACIGAYEALGAFAEEIGNHFLAADAYEHAAEMMVKAGRTVSGYRKPIEQWGKNAARWRGEGNEGDALWSERRIGLYQALFGVDAE